MRAEALLMQRGVATIEKIRVDLQPEERQAMMQRTGRHTVPQIFINDRHVGGCDDLMALDAAGGLMPLLTADN
jgi:glutaredoxin 3